MRIASAEPMADECSNPGRDDFWTCPGCYTDLGCIGEGDHTCPHCDRDITCTIEHQPVCTTRLREKETDE